MQRGGAPLFVGHNRIAQWDAIVQIIGLPSRDFVRRIQNADILARIDEMVESGRRLNDNPPESWIRQHVHFPIEAFPDRETMGTSFSGMNVRRVPPRSG